MDDQVVILKAQLERKATFESGLRGLLQLAEQGPPEPSALLPSASRVHALLRARYSNPAWLRLGSRLFGAILAVGGGQPLDAQQRAKVEGYLSDVRKLLPDEEEDGTQRERTLGELLGFAAPQASASHLSDAGLVLDHAGPVPAANGVADDLLRLLGMQATGGVQQQEVEQQGQEQQHFEEQQQGEQQQQQQEEGEQRQQDAEQQEAPPLPEISDLAGLQALLQQLYAHHNTAAGAATGVSDGSGSGGGGNGDGAGAIGDAGNAVARMTPDEVLEELQIMMATVASQAGAPHAPSRPPASRKVVANLPVETLDEAAAEQAEKDGEACPVCCERWRAGEEQQQLPCGHRFHPACNAPWLVQHNSCPVCRHELPTDDQEYEARKEKEKELEEERRGAAAALSHNEFMYI